MAESSMSTQTLNSSSRVFKCDQVNCFEAADTEADARRMRA